MNSTPTLLRDLASPDIAVRQRASVAAMKSSRALTPPGSLHLSQRFVSFFEGQWRGVSEDRKEIICALARTMAHPQTDLLLVNLLTYALAAAGEDGVTELLVLLRHEDFAVHTYAAEGLGSLGNRSRWALPSLFRALTHPSGDWTSVTIIRAIGNIGGARAVDMLQSLVREARRANPPDTQLLQVLELALASASTRD